MSGPSDPVRWLARELPELVARGVLDAATAERLRDHYALAAERRRGIRSLALAALGALLVGGGIILLVAHNWSELGRPARTVIALAPLLVAQALAVWVVLRRGGSAAWQEGSAIAVVAGVGTAIALVAQTYQIPGDLHGFLGTWLVLTLPLVYLLRSTAVAVFALATSVYWAATMEDGVPAAWLLFLAALLPVIAPALRHGWRSDRERLLGWSFALSVVAATPLLVVDLTKAAWLPALGIVLAALALEGWQHPGDDPRWRARPLTLVGTLGGASLAWYLGFEGAWRWGWPGRGDDWQDGAQSWAVVAVLALLLLRVVHLGIRAARQRAWPEATLAALAPAAVLAWALRLATASEISLLFAVAWNAYLFALALIFLASGLRDERPGRVNGGLALVALVILTRFFDSDLPLLARGAAFVAVGLGFLLANRVLERRLTARTGGAMP